MELYDVSFFCHDGTVPECHMDYLNRVDFGESITVSLNNNPGSPHGKPSITIHLENELALIAFKNNVLWAYEKFMRER